MAPLFTISHHRLLNAYRFLNDKDSVLCQCEGLYVLWLILSQSEIFSVKKYIFLVLGIKLGILWDMYLKFYLIFTFFDAGNWTQSLEHTKAEIYPYSLYTILLKLFYKHEVWEKHQVQKPSHSDSECEQSLAIQFTLSLTPKCCQGNKTPLIWDHKGIET